MSGKQFAVIVVITFIVGVIWLVSDIIFNTKPSVPVKPEMETLLQPINPNFNPRVLNIIAQEVSSPNNQPLATPPPAAIPSAPPLPSPRPSVAASGSPLPSLPATIPIGTSSGVNQ